MVFNILSSLILIGKIFHNSKIPFTSVKFPCMISELNLLFIHIHKTGERYSADELKDLL